MHERCNLRQIIYNNGKRYYKDIISLERLVRGLHAKTHIYLDDVRTCPPGFLLAKTVAQCLTMLQKYDVGILSLDHDLGWDEPTGYQLTKQMVELNLYPQHIYLHTADPIGRMNMYQLLYRYKPAHVQLHNQSMPDDVKLRVQQRDNESRERD